MPPSSFHRLSLIFQKHGFPLITPILLKDLGGFSDDDRISLLGLCLGKGSVGFPLLSHYTSLPTLNVWVPNIKQFSTMWGVLQFNSVQTLSTWS